MYIEKSRKSISNLLSFNMQHWEFEPPEELQEMIKCFWYNRRDLGEQPSDFEVMPDGYAEIIFYFGNTLRISSNGNLHPLPSPFMMGLLNQPARFSTSNRFEIIGIRCFPWTVFDLLGLSSGKAGVQTFEHQIAALQPVLQEHIKNGHIHEAIAQVKTYFLNSEQGIIPDHLLSRAGVAMSKTNGTLPVNQVASAAHATIRTLERKFKKSSGHTVKDVSALMRFEQVRNQLWRDPDSNLAALAQEFGYTDQSHLSREFKRYSGTTPAAFARKAKQDKQIIPSDFITFIKVQ